MMKLCLTGSISTGKTTVSSFMSELGAIIIDTDLVTHNLYKYPSEASNKILEAFGLELLKEDNTIDRKKLGAIVFKDKEKLEILNKIVHPLVRKEVYAQRDYYLSKEKGRNFLLVYVIPLYFEAGKTYEVDAIVVSACSKENQLKRLMLRDNCSQEEAERRINSQISIEEKIKQADYIIDTNKTKEEIKVQVSNLLSKFSWDKYENE